MYGIHCLRHWSSRQPTFALSSGEAELGGLSKGAAQGIGLRSVGNDLGLKYVLNMHTDATAAMGMSRRVGVGKIRHLDTALLWIQDKVRSGDVLLNKVPGPDNPADSLTKFLAYPDLQRHLARMSLVIEEGRADSAPRLA